jgi:hypothetical protein
LWTRYFCLEYWLVLLFELYYFDEFIIMNRNCSFLGWARIDNQSLRARNARPKAVQWRWYSGEPLRAGAFFHLFHFLFLFFEALQIIRHAGQFYPCDNKSDCAYFFLILFIESVVWRLFIIY